MKIYYSIAALMLASTISSQETPRPNILWLTYEDTSPEFIGCYGNEQARTPNIDNMAKEGVRFTSAFSTGAVSSASRFCLITGIRPTSMGTGNHRSNYPIPQNINGFPYYLRQAGYYTTNNAKTDYNIANEKQFTAKAWDESSNEAGWWNRKPGQPFFAVYNSSASHQSRTMTNTWKKYEQQVLQYLNPSEIINEGQLELPQFYRNSTEMQHQISRVYNSIALMDKEFGQWMTRLEKDGLKDSTIVFCFSDHGEGITRSKGCAFGTGYQVAFVAWFPPMYKHLSPWGDGVITDELVSFEDMAPTVLQLAGLEVPEYMQGRVFMGKKPQPEKKYVFSAVDRTDESSELSRSITDGRYLFTRVFMPFQPFIRWNMYYDVSDLQKTIRKDFRDGLLNKTQREMLEPRQAEYLFDLKEDKWETVNLIDRGEMKAKADELRNALRKELTDKRDAHFMTEYAFITSKSIPQKLAVDDKNYPIDKILDAAFTVGKGKKYIAEQLLMATDDNPYVRYWATMGLFSQEKGLKFKGRQLVDILQKETFPPARIQLEMLLFKISNKKEYLEQVRKLINQKDPELLRMTLHLLIAMDSPKQLLLIGDIEKKYNDNINDKIKGMHPCNQLMEMLLHKHKGRQIISNDAF
jgi:arylsulfatase A-like enzyme